ncbi:MAG: L-2-amino-thiazoline-4-carboxylic acid hydrolase [Candidatus Thorarchaeota archaeon]
MNQNEEKTDISHVVVRELQAPLVSALIKGYACAIGEDKAFEIAQEIINEDAILSGKTLAEKVSGNTLKDLLTAIQEFWTKDGAMELDNICLDEDRLSFDVTYCGYAEMYRKLGIQELGTLMSCSRDFAFMDGFNPKIELKRTKTIMEGDSICNFCYVMKRIE